MPRTSRTSLVASCLLLFAAFTVCAQEGSTRYDGHWWRGLSGPVRLFFLAGYLDCYEYEYKGPARFRTKSYDRYRALITKAYEDGRARQTAMLSDVLDQFRDKPGEKEEYAGGEPVSGPHGGNDGLTWRNLDHDGQVAFVEGYLFCHEHLNRNKGGVFSRAPDDYRVLISRWYRLDESTRDVDPDREPVPIADVLFKVRVGGRNALPNQALAAGGRDTKGRDSFVWRRAGARS